jgi:hypothetical protein
VWGNEGPQLAQGEKDKKPRSLPTLLPSLQNITLPLLTPPASNGEAGDVKAAESIAVTAAAPPAATSKSAGVPPIRVGGGHSRSGSNGLGSGRKGAASAGKKSAATDSSLAAGENAIGGGGGSGAGPLDPVVSVVCGAFHCLALTSSGAVVSWGRGADGALGHGDNRDREVPTLIASLSPSHEPALLAAAIAAANAPVVKAPAHGAAGRFAPLSSASSSSAAVGAAAAGAAGSAASISLGQSSSGGPPPLSPFLKVVAVAAGGAHSLVRAVPLPSAVRRDEHGSETPLAAPTVLSFGLGAAGATGLGVCDDTNAPHAVSLFSGARVLQLVAGGDCSEAVVQREAGGAAVALVADEDDLPNAVLEELI